MWNTTGITVQPTLLFNNDPMYSLEFDDAGIDLRNLISPRMRCKITQDGIDRFCIATDVQEKILTVIAVCSDNSPDKDILNTSSYPITGFSYSGEAVPFGFPSLSSFIIEKRATSIQTVSNPIVGQGYNLGSNYIDLPPAEWALSYSALMLVDGEGLPILQAAGLIGFSTTATNLNIKPSVSRVRFSRGDDGDGGAVYTYMEGNASKSVIVKPTEVRRYYLNVAALTTVSKIHLRNDVTDMLIQAVLIA